MCSNLEGRLRCVPAKLACGNALRVSAVEAHRSSLNRAKVQVLAKDASHHGDKSKHDCDDDHNLQHNSGYRLLSLQVYNGYPSLSPPPKKQNQ